MPIRRHGGGNRAWKLWVLWGWQRFQQFVGALLVLLLAGTFLAYVATGKAPGNWLGDDFQKDIPIEKSDTRDLDHVHLAVAIGSCHSQANPVVWPEHWLQTLRLDRSMLQQVASGATDGPGISAAGFRGWNAFRTPPTDDLAHADLTSYERSAIYHSDRIRQERGNYLEEAELRRNRIRHNQIRILLLSAAGAFLVGMTTLVASKDADAPFKSLTKGALLPISALALLMPLLSTAISGVVAFDDDITTALRDHRTLAQLEQLHGRIVEDVTSDPFRCPAMRAAQTLEGIQAGAELPAAAGLSHLPADGLSLCIMDRMQRTVAWQQRHEQILNDATQTLARAGDLVRGDAKAPRDPASKASRDPASGQEAATSPHADPCQDVFGVSGQQMIPGGARSEAKQPVIPIEASR
jgi:hypothetical protein